MKRTKPCPLMAAIVIGMATIPASTAPSSSLLTSAGLLDLVGQAAAMDHFGDVHERDPGLDASKHAAEITEYNPTDDWTPVED